MTDPAFVLLGVPVQVKGADGGVGGGDAVEDDDVDVVAEVDPDGDEEAEVWGDDVGVEVGESFGCLRVRGSVKQWFFCGGKVEGLRTTHGKEEVADVMGDVHRQPHVGEMKSVAQPDQCQRDDVMTDQFAIIPPGFLQSEAQDQGLLGPVTRLQQVVGLEHGIVRAVGEGFVHACSVEIPDGGAIHDIQAVGPEDAKI